MFLGRAVICTTTGYEVGQMETVKSQQFKVPKWYGENVLHEVSYVAQATAKRRQV